MGLLVAESRTQFQLSPSARGGTACGNSTESPGQLKKPSSSFGRIWKAAQPPGEGRARQSLCPPGPALRRHLWAFPMGWQRGNPCSSPPRGFLRLPILFWLTCLSRRAADPACRAAAARALQGVCPKSKWASGQHRGGPGGMGHTAAVGIPASTPKAAKMGSPCYTALGADDQKGRFG